LERPGYASLRSTGYNESAQRQPLSRQARSNQDTGPRKLKSRGSHLCDNKTLGRLAAYGPDVQADGNDDPYNFDHRPNKVMAPLASASSRTLVYYKFSIPF